MVNLHCCRCERPSKLVGDISQPDLRRIGRISAQGKVEKNLSKQKRRRGRIFQYFKIKNSCNHLQPGIHTHCRKNSSAPDQRVAMPCDPVNVACTSGYLHGGKNENRKLLRFVRVGQGGDLHDLVLVDIQAGGLEIKENQERRHRNREQERGSPATEALPQDVTSVTGVPCGSNVPTRQQRGETVSFLL